MSTFSRPLPSPRPRSLRAAPRRSRPTVTAYQDRSVQDINQLFGPKFKDQWDYLNKPFTQGEIIQKARQMTGAWNRKRHLEEAMDQLKAAQEQLVRAEKMAAIGQVARGIGHEFGNILQRIVGKADLALMEKDSAKQAAHAKVILEAADRAAVIVRNLQSFSKGTSQREPIDLSKVIGDTLVLVNHEFAKYSVELVDKRSAVASIQANAGELQQVLLNLMINAFHAMPGGGKLEVGCADENGVAVLWVKDSGSGIPPEVLPKIFEYAFTTKGDRGSGLGLSISQQIAESHGGKLEVESAPGKGSTFRMRIPRAK
ncbi:MAG: HAMP domain-containing histidine kinase [Deltaproteobacteria bacterium]|nr:HAMP domain-containing histidine kinase [Deltaproteobacteria bacterium]